MAATYKFKNNTNRRQRELVDFLRRKNWPGTNSVHFVLCSVVLTMSSYVCMNVLKHPTGMTLFTMEDYSPQSYKFFVCLRKMNDSLPLVFVLQIGKSHPAAGGDHSLLGLLF